jgi:nicotinate-nucleotide adenylyltransferase
MGIAAVGAGVTGAIGVFGGTFDPVHIAHLAVAEEAADTLGLERVLFIPAGLPPHKPDRAITAGEHRLAMVELAIAGNPRFVADRREIDRPGRSYTVDTLESLRHETASEIALIISADSFLDLLSWREPRRILELARLVVAPREGYPAVGADTFATDLPGIGERTSFLDGPHLHLSASELRARAAGGRSLRYLVPDAVAAYIGDHALYTDPTRTPTS